MIRSVLSGFRLVEEDGSKPIVVEDYIDDTSSSFNHALYARKRKARRSFSMGDKHGSCQGDEPQETIDDLQLEVFELRRTSERSRRENVDLRKGLERVETLLQMEQSANRELEKEKLLANEEILCLQNDMERLDGCRKTPLILEDNLNAQLDEEQREEDFGDPFVRHSSWSNLAVPSTELEKRPRRRKTSAPCGPSKPMMARSPSVSKAKTLCFQISFNGMTLMEKTDFGEA